MVNVTGTVCGVLVAPVAVMVIVPLYVPALKPEIAAVIVIVPGAVPLVGESVSHAALDEVVQFNVPPPELEMFNACVAGLLPPCMPLKVKLVGLQDIQGD